MLLTLSVKVRYLPTHFQDGLEHWRGACKDRPTSLAKKEQLQAKPAKYTSNPGATPGLGTPHLPTIPSRLELRGLLRTYRWLRSPAHYRNFPSSPSPFFRQFEPDRRAKVLYCTYIHSYSYLQTAEPPAAGVPFYSRAPRANAPLVAKPCFSPLPKF